MMGSWGAREWQQLEITSEWVIYYLYEEDKNAPVKRRFLFKFWTTDGTLYISSADNTLSHLGNIDNLSPYLHLLREIYDISLLLS